MPCPYFVKGHGDDTNKETGSIVIRLAAGFFCLVRWHLRNRGVSMSCCLTEKPIQREFYRLSRMLSIAMWAKS